MTDYKASKRITGTNAERIGLSTNPDTLGTSANGTNTGVTLDTTNEKLGSGCYSFDANLDYTRMDAGATTFTDKGTIALWIKATNNVSARTAISSKADASTNPQIMVRGTDTDQFEMVIAGIAETIPPAVTEGTWYHVAITWDQTANVCKAYLNGSLEATKSNGGTDFTGNDTCRWIIGQGYNVTQATRTWDGLIDDFGLWSRILEDSEIADLATPQGYKGGNFGGGGTNTTAGGGGAGGAGATDTSSGSGNGGIGKANPITGSEVGELSNGVYYLAGGGGGGSHTVGTNTRGLGGLGGGGDGGDSDDVPTAGTANTGGGGGGDTNGGTSTGQAGGSGVVIVSYKTSEITDDSSDGSLETGSNIPSGYAIRKFTSSGTFSIQSGSGNVQYVIIAGGGGSGSNVGGGGGAGGFITNTKSMSAGDYTVTVGAGGAGCNVGNNTRAVNGGNSVFDGVTALGGGFGADNDISPNINAGNGGSGGGGTYRSGATLGGSGSAGLGALVSSLSDTSGLKAYYSMDTNTNNTCPNDAVKVNPNIQSNSIWEASDTGKHYIFDGSAWTEVA